MDSRNSALDSLPKLSDRSKDVDNARRTFARFMMRPFNNRFSDIHLYDPSDVSEHTRNVLQKPLSFESCLSTLFADPSWFRATTLHLMDPDVSGASVATLNALDNFEAERIAAMSVPAEHLVIFTTRPSLRKICDCSEAGMKLLVAQTRENDFKEDPSVIPDLKTFLEIYMRSFHCDGKIDMKPVVFSAILKQADSSYTTIAYILVLNMALKTYFRIIEVTLQDLQSLLEVDEVKLDTKEPSLYLLTRPTTSVKSNAAICLSMTSLGKKTGRNWWKVVKSFKTGRFRPPNLF